MKVKVTKVQDNSWMKTPITGIHYWTEDGKYTIDGYDFFDTMEELETSIYWQRLWIDGKAMMTDTGWKLI